MLLPDNCLSLTEPLTGRWFNRRSEWAENWMNTELVSYQFGVSGGGGGVYTQYHSVTWDLEYRFYDGVPLERALKILTKYPATDIREQKATYLDTGGVPGVTPANPVVSSTYTYDYGISQARSASISSTQQNGVWLPNYKDETGRVRADGMRLRGQRHADDD